MTAGPNWPHATFRRQYSRIGRAVLQLMADESRWIHRRLESLVLMDATTLARSVRVDYTAPANLADELTLASVLDDQGRPAVDSSLRLVLPLALIPKAPLLLGLTVEGNGAEMLTRDQGQRLLVSAFAEDLRETGLDLGPTLRLVASIVGDDAAGAAEQHTELSELLDPVIKSGAQAQAKAARRIKDRTHVFIAQTTLLVAVESDAGVPTSVTYAYEQPLGGKPAPSFLKAPLRVDLPLSGHSRVRHVLELEAPESFEVEAAAIYRPEGGVVQAEATAPGAGRLVRLVVPRGQAGPFRLVASLGFAPYGLPVVALVAAGLSTTVLILAAIMSELLGSRLGTSGSGTLLALPALVSSAVIGAASTRVTNLAVSLLRAAGLTIALLGLMGGIAISVLGYEKTSKGPGDKDVKTYPALAARSTVLWGLAGAALVLTLAGPLTAATRPRVKHGDLP